MTRRPLARRTALSAVLLVLTLIAWASLQGAIRQWPRAETPGQYLETVVQLAAGILGGAVALTCLRPVAWASGARAAWAVTLALAAGLSGLVWGPPMPVVALAMGGGALLLAVLLIWAMEAAGTW